MRKITSMIVLGFSVLVATSFLANAEYNPNKEKLTLICNDIRDIRDGGIQVKIYEGGNIGQTWAQISENTIAGEMHFGNVLVKRTENNGFTGQNFKLVINTDTRLENGGYPSDLNTVVNGSKLDAELRCKYLLHTL